MHAADERNVADVEDADDGPKDVRNVMQDDVDERECGYCLLLATPLGCM